MCFPSGQLLIWALLQNSFMLAWEPAQQVRLCKQLAPVLSPVAPYTTSESRQEWSLSKAEHDAYKQENNSQVGWSTHVATGLCWLAAVLACAPTFPASPPGCPHRWPVSRPKHLNLTPHVKNRGHGFIKTWQVIKHFLLDQSYMRER